MKATHKDWILFNGRMINTKEEQPMVALEERGFQFGDGIYEVFRLYDGKPHLLDLHLERFFNSMAEIKLIPPFTKEELVEELYQMIKKSISRRWECIFTNIKRAQPRNHVYESDLQPTYFANLVSFPRPVASMEAGIKVTVEEDIRWKFCHIKSLNLLPNIMIKTK